MIADGHVLGIEAEARREFEGRLFIASDLVSYRIDRDGVMSLVSEPGTRSPQAPSHVPGGFLSRSVDAGFRVTGFASQNHRSAVGNANT